MGSLMAELEAREAAARGRAEALRARIAELTERLAAEDELLSRLGITRRTVWRSLAAMTTTSGPLEGAAPRKAPPRSVSTVPPKRSRKDGHMAAEDKMRNKAQELEGRAKEATGRATGNLGMEAEGRAERAKGSLKQAGEKIKDAFRRRPPRR
jgi:uncharacterized protein YjbJ (UPF0337 family)